MKQEKEFNISAITDRLLKYGVTVKYAAGVASEIGNLESHCKTKFINKAEINDIIKHHFIRVESKINASRVEALKWYIGISFIQISGIISTVIAIMQIYK